jgi:4-amino-4-deoxy-L-arabinose transferase-like glycosyltransferase
MSTSSASMPFRLPRPRARARASSAVARRPELLALLVLAAVLNLWALSLNGFANEYYAAAVRSMSTSWHAFLYGSFDQGGVMTVDKPPLALWVQALSVRMFGFSSWSILMPQALMGVATVGLSYDLVRRYFGRVAGTVAGLVLVATPTMVAVSRHNNPDALLALCCVGALWCVVRGLRDGRARWLVLSGVCVGLGFETKMAAALMVVPAIAAAWLWLAPRGRLAAVRQLLAGGVAMVVVGGAWPLLVALTPAGDRPWISGTADNSIWSLILGYNGLGRIFGQAGGPAGGGGPGGGGFFGGDPGPLRLLNASLGGQGGWLLGFAAVAGIGLIVVTRLRRADARTGWLIAAGGSFAITSMAFSAASGIFHPYYVSQLAPFAAMLCGAGAGLILEDGRTARWLAPLAIAGGVATELVVLHNDPGTFTWLPGVLVAGGLGAAAALAGGLVAGRLRASVLAGGARAAGARAGDVGRADARPSDQRHVPQRRPGVGRDDGRRPGRPRWARRWGPARRRLRRRPAGRRGAGRAGGRCGRRLRRRPAGRRGAGRAGGRCGRRRGRTRLPERRGRRGRRRDVRRRHVLAERGRELRQAARRRDGRGLQPVRSRRLAHHVRSKRRCDRRLLRARERGRRHVARRRGARRAHPLGPDVQRRSGRDARQPHRLDDGDGRGQRRVQAGERRRQPVRLLAERGRAACPSLTTVARGARPRQGVARQVARPPALGDGRSAIFG